MNARAGLRDVLAVSALLGTIPAAGWAQAAAERPSESPMVFIWRVDNEKPELKAPAGSGFLLGPDGTILTSKHVTEHNDFEHLEISIGSKSANPVPAQNDIDCDAVYDFCFLRILPVDVKAAAIDPGEYYRVSCRPIGDEAVLAYGFLEGNSGVSHVRGATTTGAIQDGLVMTSAGLQAGMSGGPVFDVEGKVIAIVKGGSEKQTAIQPIMTASSYFPRHGHTCTGGPPPVGPVVLPVAATLAGVWTDKDGGNFFIGRNGDMIAIDGRTVGGSEVYSGTGTVKGAELNFRLKRFFDGPSMRVDIDAYSGDCVNDSDRGCTIETNPPACTLSPPGSVFDTSRITIQSVASEGVNVNEPCRVTEATPDRICVVAHAESGSGLSRIGKAASRTCRVSAAVIARDSPETDCTGALVAPTMIMMSCTAANGANYPWILISAN